MDNRTALLVGNSDGIGLAVTVRLLAEGWNVTGISRSRSPVDDPSYYHHVCDVTSNEFSGLVEAASDPETPDLCIYFAGIGELLDLSDMRGEVHVIDVNLNGMVRTAVVVIPLMVKRGCGHFIGLSSVADELPSAQAPSYHASKAGFSNYLSGLAAAVKPAGVHVTNIRFGFVDTKMAKGDIKPFMMGVEKAAGHVLRCIEKRPAVYTAPKVIIPLLKFRKWMMKIEARLR